jgi:hypothetical protein
MLYDLCQYRHPLLDLSSTWQPTSAHPYDVFISWFYFLTFWRGVTSSSDLHDRLPRNNHYPTQRAYSSSLNPLLHILTIPVMPTHLLLVSPLFNLFLSSPPLTKNVGTKVDIYYPIYFLLHLNDPLPHSIYPPQWPRPWFPSSVISLICLFFLFPRVSPSLT